MSDVHLELKRTVSRAADTYGYDRLTLTDTATGRKFVAVGGGYDMIGTVFGSWLQSTHQDRLLAIASRASAVVHADGRTEELPDLPGASRRLYGMTYSERQGTEVVRLQGAAGTGAMRDIAAALGLRVRVLSNRSGNITGFIVTDAD